MTEFAFVLGNGTSRKQIPIQKLKELGTVYGCNAIYRECSVDHLIAVDTKMIREIYDSGYHLENKVYTNPNKYTKTLKDINILNPNKGWSSGPTAMFVASKNNHRVIVILGFDYTGLGDKNQNVNNIYAGTLNYKGINEKAINIENKKFIIECKKRYFRPLEVDYLKGNAQKAKKLLKWSPKISIDDLINEMVEHELEDL